MTDAVPFLPVARFIRAIAVLALPPVQQIQWLRSLGLGEPAQCDELALEFDDGFLQLQTFVRKGAIPVEAASILIELDSHLDAMSGGQHAHLWSLEALTGAPEWEQVRRLAGEAICALE